MMIEKRNVLLLGAGFSKNFNGYLAKDVYLEIFNHPKLTNEFKKFLLKPKFFDNDDFELYYESIKGSSEFTENEKNTIEGILLDIYKKMDEQFQRVIQAPLGFSYLSLINFLINKFSYSRGGAGYIFTLNQDLLLERLFADYLKILEFSIPGGWNGEKQGALLPHYGPINSPYYKYHKDDKEAFQDFDALDKITTEEIEKWREKSSNTYEQKDRTMPCLIKLHGSYRWRDKNSKALWILGNNKPDKIKLIPMLELYFKKLEEILSSPKKIYIIGYSFRDKHINEVISKSCINGSQLIVVDVDPFKKWFVEIKRLFRKMKLPDFSSDWLECYHNKLFTILFDKREHEKNFKFSHNDQHKNVKELEQFQSIYL